MADRVITLRSGRVLGLSAAGDPMSQRLVLVCHPTPGAGGFDPDPELTNRWGVHLVGFDRPGYGSSTALPDQQAPSIARHADDLAEYLQVAMEQAGAATGAPVGSAGVIGWSAGGRIALALAARHPGIVDRVAVVATPAPDSAVQWIPPELAAVNAELAALPPAEARARLRPMLEQQLAGGSSLALLGASAADDAALQRPGVRDRLERMLHRAYEQGVVGVADDILAAATDEWGFDLGAVRAQVLLVYGAADRTVPSAHGRWYRRHLPHAKLTVVPRSGHLAIVGGWQRILEHVDPQHGRVPDA